MKNKYIFSFLILIILTGALNPITEVGAQGAGVPEIKPSAPTPIDVLQKDQAKQIEELLKISEEAKKNKLYSTQKTTEGVNSNYILLEPLPCKEGTPNCEPGGSLTEFDTKGTGQLGTYLNLGITLFIGLCAVAAVVMITIAGIEYSTAELVSNKAAAKDKIQNALLGLLLALCSWLILNTINPDLLRTDFEISGVELGVDYEEIVNVVGVGVIVDGTRVAIKKGGAAPCVGGQVTIPNSFNINPKTRAVVCNNLYTKLALLKTKVNFRITSTTTGTHGSSCHAPGNIKSGNCVDIVPTSTTTWDELCVAVASVGGLNFLNEGSRTPKCNAISPFTKSKHWTGYHLHVNFIGP
jgi:hypothetical protein